ncbi:lipoprotein [Nonomuraea bangladeshensis]|uniref:Lipoprotein n=1 Tax=Nonomuraea bangladeshensis TaxID=404385 RepID=A0ABV3H3E6_9ACTN
MRRITVALTALLALTGCGQNSGEGGLKEAMAAVSGEGPAAAYFEYGEPAWWRDLGVKAGSAEARRWLPASVSGLGSFASAAAALPEATGMTPTAGTRAISIGVPPHQAFRFDGEVDADAVRKKLTAHGAKPREMGGHEGLSFSPGDEIDLSRTIVPGVTNQLNQVVVTDSLVATASSPDPLTAVLGGDTTLADKPAYAAMASCLGDVAAATITTSPSETVTLYGVGLRRPAGLNDRPVNVICVLPSASAATDVERALTTRLVPTGTMGDGGTYGKHAPEIAHDRVSSDDHTVLRAVLTLNDTANAMFANQLLVRGDLQTLTKP